MSDKYFEQMDLDEEQKSIFKNVHHHTGVDVRLHYFDQNSIKPWNSSNDNTVLANEIQNLRMQNELQKQKIELLRSEVTMMKERLDNYLKYERRRMGTTEVGDRNNTADGAEQTDTLQHIRHKCV